MRRVVGDGLVVFATSFVLTLVFTTFRIKDRTKGGPKLDTEAKAGCNQERRTKLLELANELDAGTVKHRVNRRTTALNRLRLDAIKELRTEAALSERVKDLPGPDASEWLYWACRLQDAKDELDLISLHRDFWALDRFVGQMDERYWISGRQAYEDPGQRHESSEQSEASL